MDILQEYEKNQPKAQLPSAMQTSEQLLAQRYVSDTGFFVRLVMETLGREDTGYKEGEFGVGVGGRSYLGYLSLPFLWWHSESVISGYSSSACRIHK